MKTKQLLFGSIFAIAAAVLPIASASAATVNFLYTGLTFAYQPPLNDPAHVNPYGPRMTGFASFDDAVVTVDFTGSVDNLVFLAPGGSPSFGTFTFSNGEIVGWDLESIAPWSPDGSTQVTTTSINSAGQHFDSIRPLNFRFDLSGSVFAEGAGVWAREVAVAPVPLPAALPMLTAVLGLLGVFRRRSR